ncbi:uncharacterized protein [Palaemon carinicauda]|uniref:uncharacterized protein n=1 Tax=Palaemon carinicauda TaxID=392227 RepID=UPI0035B6438D
MLRPVNWKLVSALELVHLFKWAPTIGKMKVLAIAICFLAWTLASCHRDTGVSCTYWCQTRDQRFYCCDSGGQGERRGYCPPVRSICPQASFFRPPTSCANDNSCRDYKDKCCYDQCLKLRVCKPAQGTRFG